MQTTVSSIKTWIFLFLLAFTAHQEAVFAGDLVLSQPLMRELNQVLKVSASLHRSLVTQNEEQVEIGLRDVLGQIDRARSTSRLAKDYERGHLLRILDVARERFEMTQSSYGDERRVLLEEGFNQLANLVRIYRLDRTYGIFFCPRDKTTWVQKGMKPENPFRPELRSPCGMKVPN